MTDTPVVDWATDYDIFSDEYVSNPFAIWEDLRDRCPIAHTDRLGGSWLPTRFEDVDAMAHDVQRFSSRSISVVPPAEGSVPVPPIDADPPVHTWSRRLILPWFSHTRVDALEPLTRALCNRLIDGFIATGRGDAAGGYAQQIPVRVIAQILGVPPEMSDTFTGWVRDILEFAFDKERRDRGRTSALSYLAGQMQLRKENPSDDLISYLLSAEVDGKPAPELHILGTAGLTLVAGVDTTWSAIGSSLWHLATHEEDRRRLVEEPEIMPLAIEEFLRMYSPVTMARIVTEDVEFNGCPMKEGDRVLMNFPAANRDPREFDRADEFVIDREVNRHIAFGAGIHRCAGSNLARMELRVAIETWLERIPEFRAEDPSLVTWAGGQVRGPRYLPVVF
jgi:cytochrome P450